MHNQDGSYEPLQQLHDIVSQGWRGGAFVEGTIMHFVAVQIALGTETEEIIDSLVLDHDLPLDVAEGVHDAARECYDEQFNDWMKD